MEAHQDQHDTKGDVSLEDVLGVLLELKRTQTELLELLVTVQGLLLLDDDDNLEETFGYQQT